MRISLFVSKTAETLVEALIRDDPDTLRLWRQAVTRPNHRPAKTSDNVTTNDGRGNSLAYTLDRLQRHHPALYERVVAGELSAHAAAIEAGIRKPPKAGLCRAWRQATPEERAAFIEENSEPMTGVALVRNEPPSRYKRIQESPDCLPGADIGRRGGCSM